MIPEYPPSFDGLRGFYRNFEPVYEHRRESFGEWWNFYLRQMRLDDFESEIRVDTQFARAVKNQLRQRYFYRSATCFYRAFDLFLGFLSLQRNLFGTWSDVTGYYCRFYFIQALLNLLQANWFGAEDSIPKEGIIDPSDANFFGYHTGVEYRFLKGSPLLAGLEVERNLGSHAMWRKVFEKLNGLPGFPRLEALEFVLSDGYFNAEKRNEVNYSHEYIRGFPELEWFDSSQESMMSHFGFQSRRADRDITNIERFFIGVNPEEDYFDGGDFYGDEAQMLWSSIDCYLRLLKALEIQQDFITIDKLDALTGKHIGEHLPNITAEIATGVRDALEG